mmetsp:Transcript_33564/g.34861  ORF Transcript_33564/g.34861 Transcript_33564/m.34861 type:complete len:127 (+) Transcript_33564:15-395(+)
MVDQEENEGNNMQFPEERDNVYDDYGEFDGEKVTLTLINSKTQDSFKEEFKGGQDFEYVKYVISKKLNVNIEGVTLYNDGKKLIPLFSICDVVIKDNIIQFDAPEPEPEIVSETKEVKNGEEDDDL